MNKQRVILGPPGCGKTTFLIDRVREAMDAGLEPERICFVSFTRKAAHEAAERMQKEFGFEPNRLRYFRTLHSIAYRALRVPSDTLMTKTDWETLGLILGVDFSTFYVTEEGLPVGGEKGDKLRFIDGYARSRLISIERAWKETDYDNISLQEAIQFSATYTQYRDDHSVWDYTDMLEQFVEQRIALDVDVAIIDEAQDLSTLQWRMAEQIADEAQDVYIAGDDDQAIYKWSGADVGEFLHLKGDRQVLSQSYRLPRTVYNLANQISAQISDRYEKEWSPRDEEGTVERVSDFQNVDLSEGTWLLLARNAYMLNDLKAIAKQQGVPYAVKGVPAYKKTHTEAIIAWERLRNGNALRLDEVLAIYGMMKAHSGIKRGYKKMKGALEDELYTLDELQEHWGLLRDDLWYDALEAIPAEDRTYLQSVLRSGSKLTSTPRVNISTIHSIKGGEADNVLLLTDLAYRTWREYMANPDDEHRVFFVAVTRAKHRLILVEPSGRCYYSL